MTANRIVPRCIWPKTSNRSSPLPAVCASAAFSAPAIHHADLDAGFLITEDFGSAGFVEGDPPAPIAERYEAATDLLAALHHETLPEILPLAPQLTYAIPTFDTDALLIEMGLMLDWYLPDRGIDLSSSLRSEFVLMWRDLLSKPTAAAKTWVLRDFHSPNLIWLAERPGIAKVGIIDFQDTVLGPALTTWRRCCRMRGSTCPNSSSLRS